MTGQAGAQMSNKSIGGRMNRRIGFTTAACAAAALALPVSAAARTKTVYAGPPAAAHHLLSKAFANKYTSLMSTTSSYAV